MDIGFDLIFHEPTDYELVKTQQAYWIKVLKYVEGILSELCPKGVSLKKDNFNSLPSTSNDDNDVSDSYKSRSNGQFIRLLKCVATFDLFLADHIREFSGDAISLSFDTYKGFIKLMEQKVYNSIIGEIKAAKYFSIIINCDYRNPSKQQIIFRYVKTNGKPVERVLCFLESENLVVNTVLHILKANDLDIKDCRGLGYDHSAHMSNKYLELQTTLKESCTYAVYVPYSAYSLNSIDECLAIDCLILIECFNLTEKLSILFSNLQFRDWGVSAQHSTKNISFKTIFDMEWSNRDDACYNLSHNWKEIIMILCEYMNKNNCVLNINVANILDSLKSLEMCITVSVWSDVIKQLNITNNEVRDLSNDLETITSLYNSLILYISGLKYKFDHYETICIQKSRINEYGTTKLLAINDLLNPGNKRKLEYNNLKEEFKTNLFLPVIDSIVTELKKRQYAYIEINNKFGFFFHLTEMEPHDVHDKAKTLQKYYPDDLSVEYFPKECIKFRKVLLNLSNIPKTILEIYQKLIEIGVQDVFPEVYIAFRICLCSPAINFSINKSDGIDNFGDYDRDEYHNNCDYNDDYYYYDDDNDNNYDDAINNFITERLQLDIFIYRLLNNFVLYVKNDDCSRQLNALDKIKNYQRCRKKNGSLYYEHILYTESDITKKLNYDDIIEQFSLTLVEKYM